MAAELRIRWLGPAAALLLAAGCASTPRQPSPPGPITVIPPPQQPARAVDAVIGRTAAALATLLGRPALDVREGNARKLQFLGNACILDAYLYPPGGRGEPVVTHVDTRLPDGRDAERNACVAALQQQRPRG